MRILNFGSLNLDYVYSVDHIVQPGETISGESRDVFLGGKGLNQSIALAKAGANVYHAGNIGADGSALIEALRSAGVDTTLVQCKGESSGHAIIQVDKNGQNSIVLFRGANHSVTEEQVAETFAQFEEGDWLLIQNEINNLDSIMKTAAQKGMKIILNPSPIDESLLALPLELVSCFVLNEIEGGAITGKADTEEILQTLAERFPNAEIVLTLGHDGSLYFYQGKLHRQPIYQVKAVDTTAAGDTFTGYFLSAQAKGLAPQLAMKRAAMASAIAVSKHGASQSIPCYEEVEQALKGLVYQS